MALCYVSSDGAGGGGGGILWWECTVLYLLLKVSLHKSTTPEAKMRICPVSLFNSISLLEKGVEVGLKGHRGLERKGREGHRGLERKGWGRVSKETGILRERVGDGLKGHRGLERKGRERV
jgi:hypothetical protein